MSTAPSRWTNIAWAIVRRLPAPLVRETERVMLNASLGLVGLVSIFLIDEPGALPAVLNPPLLFVWSASLIAGAGLVLVGMWRGWRTIERAGLMLTGIGSFAYGLALLALDDTSIFDSDRAHILAIPFFGMAIAKALRLLVSSVTNAAGTPLIKP